MIMMKRKINLCPNKSEELLGSPKLKRSLIWFIKSTFSSIMQIQETIDAVGMHYLSLTKKEIDWIEEDVFRSKKPAMAPGTFK
jgi:hypothetical protein